MDIIDWLKLLASVLSGIAVCIPLCQKIVTLVRESQRAKNWAPVMKLVLDLMEEAEGLFEDGASKKVYVMNAIQKASVYVEYAIDMAVVSQMIDDLCSMSKVVNPPTNEAGG